MSRRRVALGVGANAIDRIAIALMTLLLVPVLASHWGLARYGGWAMLTTVPSLFALGDLGFANAATVRDPVGVVPKFYHNRITEWTREGKGEKNAR